VLQILGSRRLSGKARGGRILYVFNRRATLQGRMDRHQNVAIILRDDFKGSLETFHTTIDLLDEIPAERKIIVVGEVSEPPGSQGPIYREIGRRLAKNVIRVIHVGNSFQRYASGARASGMSKDALIHAKKSVRKAAETLLDDLGKGDVVLIKGRDNQRLERIWLILAGRSVRCDIDFCNASSIRCAVCPMLETGWEGATFIR
jgi:UDP-N-acetylmuramoyl-tripeptide--D-alanyl-D-alanine ligase